MGSRRGMKALGWTVLLGTGLLGACATTEEPVSSGYGGSGYHRASSITAEDERLAEARDQCVHVARDFKGYRDVRVGPSVITGPDTARVQLHVLGRGSFGGYEIPCDYDARSGAAYVH